MGLLSIDSKDCRIRKKFCTLSRKVILPRFCQVSRSLLNIFSLEVSKWKSLSPDTSTFTMLVMVS